MQQPKRYLVTAALPYANGPLHIGHLAGCYLPADIYVRFLKASGKDVLFICGSDEHGVPITIKAKKEGITPQQVVDKYHEMMKKSFAEFGIDFSYYGRTSSKVHHETAQEFFKTLYDKNVFKEETTKQYYDESAKQFLADRYITGTCPRCGNTSAYGDQCEKCGTSLNATDLINPKSTLSGEKPVLKETKNWFLPMGEIQNSDQFKNYIKRFDSWKSNIKGQCNGWLTEGLQSRAMTRDLDWGVPVPLKDADGKVLYVWFDAPIGYISATKEFLQNQAPSTEHQAPFSEWWQNDETVLIHFIGKDNIVFHAIIFPMMLMTHGKYILPSNVPANEFLNLEGDKISTSRNWAVWLHEYLIDFPNRQDELRYVLTSIAPETKDSEFTWKDYQARVNNELVNTLSNFSYRTLVLTSKYLSNGYAVPEEGMHVTHILDDKALQAILHFKQELISNIENCKFREALGNLLAICRVGDQMLSSVEPWKKYNDDPEGVKYFLYHCVNIVGHVAYLSEPFLPNISSKLFHDLNLKNDKETIKSLWERKDFVIFEKGHTYKVPQMYVTRIEDEEIQKQLDRLQKIKTENNSNLQPPTSNLLKVKSDISYEDFDKLDLRVGKILEAEKVAKADKLLKLIVDLGFEKRTILSGIAEYYKPEELIGKQVTVVANLAPRKIRGIESQGMLLMAGNDFGKLFVVSSENDIEAGSVVK